MTILVRESQTAFNVGVSIPASRRATLHVQGLTGVEEVEFTTVNELEADPAVNSLRITDVTDTIDATKKVLNVANSLRQVQGPMELRIIGAGGYLAPVTVTALLNA